MNAYRRSGRCLLLRSRRRLLLTTTVLINMMACAEPEIGDIRLGEQRYRAEDAIRFKLPKVLREVSGLALDDADRLFAINDEKGVIYEIDYHEGRVLRRFGLLGGVREDFEGIAVDGETMFLVTSGGTIYRFPVGDPEQMVPFDHFPHALDCEIEGLTLSPSTDDLLVACKNQLVKDKSIGLVIHRWQLSEAGYLPSVALSVPRPYLREFLAANGRSDIKKVQPTGLAAAANGNLIVLAGRQHLLLELTTDGMLVGFATLDGSYHRQAEGIAITANHQLLIADEGDGKGDKKSRGRLSVYEPAK